MQEMHSNIYLMKSVQHRETILDTRLNSALFYRLYVHDCTHRQIGMQCRPLNASTTMPPLSTSHRPHLMLSAKQEYGMLITPASHIQRICHAKLKSRQPQEHETVTTK